MLDGLLCKGNRNLKNIKETYDFSFGIYWVVLTNSQSSCIII